MKSIKKSDGQNVEYLGTPLLTAFKKERWGFPSKKMDIREKREF